MKNRFMNKEFFKDVCTTMSSALSSAAIVSLLEGLRPAKKSKEDEDDLKKLICTVLLIIGAIAVICGVVYAVIRFVQPRLKGRPFFRKEEDDFECEEECMEDPDIAGEFE